MDEKKKEVISSVNSHFESILNDSCDTTTELTMFTDVSPFLNWRERVRIELTQEATNPSY